MDEFEVVQSLVVESPSFVPILSPKGSERLLVFSPKEGGFLGIPILDEEISLLEA